MFSALIDTWILWPAPMHAIARSGESSRVSPCSLGCSCRCSTFVRRQQGWPCRGLRVAHRNWQRFRFLCFQQDGTVGGSATAASIPIPVAWTEANKARIGDFGGLYRVAWEYAFAKRGNVRVGLHPCAVRTWGQRSRRGRGLWHHPSVGDDAAAPPGARGQHAVADEQVGSCLTSRLIEIRLVTEGCSSVNGGGCCETTT